MNKHKIRYHSRKNSASTAASTAAAAAAARSKAFHIEDLTNGGSGGGGNTSGETCDFCLKFFAKKSQYYAHVNEAHQDLVSFWMF